jgi:POT family proton-dependent oligopeptide transporter
MSSTVNSVNSVKTPQGDFLGHPKGLFVLFFTEMWERFSYYGMRALLVLYMTRHLLIEAEKGAPVFGYGGVKSFVEVVAGLLGNHGQLSTQALSSQIYGLYTGLVYFTPFFGGILADRFLGQRRSVYLGGVLMAIGHFLMAVESLFFPALLFLILGNGCFKPNISTQVGGLYAPADHRRDGAFTIFYMGINLGAMFSPLVCGTLGQKVGWHWGFGSAGVGMLLGLLIYHWGQSYLPSDQQTEHEAGLKTRSASEPASSSLTIQEWKSIGALVFLCVVNIIFWAVYEQQGNTMQLWAEDRTNWTYFGWTIPSTWFQSFNPLFIFVFSIPLTMFWNWQSKRAREPSAVTKMGIGCILLGLAFVIMIVAAKTLGPNERGSALWLIGTVLVLTFGELYLSPIGMSVVTKLAPARMVSMLMGMWLLSSFFGNYLSGILGGYYDVISKDAFFTLMTVLAVSAGFVFFAANRPLKRIMGHS